MGGHACVRRCGDALVGRGGICHQHRGVKGRRAGEGEGMEGKGVSGPAVWRLLACCCRSCHIALCHAVLSRPMMQKHCRAYIHGRCFPMGTPACSVAVHAVRAAWCVAGCACMPARCLACLPVRQHRIPLYCSPGHAPAASQRPTQAAWAGCRPCCHDAACRPRRCRGGVMLARSLCLPAPPPEPTRTHPTPLVSQPGCTAGPRGGWPQHLPQCVHALALCARGVRLVTGAAPRQPGEPRNGGGGLGLGVGGLCKRVGESER